MSKLRKILPVLIWTVLLCGLAVGLWALLIQEYYGVPLSSEAMRFERPWAALLCVGSLLALLSRGFWDGARAPRLQVSRGADIAAAPRGKRVKLRPMLTALRVAALLSLGVALAGPQSIHARDTTELEGIDIVLALDLSLSMQAADIRPNRFEATRTVVGDFVRRRPNDRMGAVVFGRDAYTLLPLTTDKTALRNVIADLELGVIEGRGTAIGNAVGVSLNRLRTSEAESKVIILLTDGDSNSGNVAPDQAAELAEAMGVKLYTILMGQKDQTKVQQGTDLFGRPLFGRGEFPVNPELLERMAKRTGGEAFLVTDRKGLERSFHTILDRLERSQIEDAGAVYGELFAAFVGVAVCLLLLEIGLGASLLRRWP